MVAAAGRLPRGRARDHRRAPARCSSLDEVQTGIGRTGALVRAPGRPASSPTSSPSPRASAAGCRSAPCLAFGDAADAARSPASTARTFGGNPVACAAALAVLDTIERDGLLDRAKRVGERARGAASRPRPPAGRRGARRRPDARHRADRAGRGRGRAAAARAPASSSTRVAPDVVRLAPPLVLTDDAGRRVPRGPARRPRRR